MLTTLPAATLKREAIGEPQIVFEGFVSSLIVCEHASASRDGHGLGGDGRLRGVTIGCQRSGDLHCRDRWNDQQEKAHARHYEKHQWRHSSPCAVTGSGKRGIPLLPSPAHGKGVAEEVLASRRSEVIDRG